MNKYKKNKNWNMFVEYDKLYATKGADEIYLIDEAKGEEVKTVYDAYCNNSFEDIIGNDTLNDIISKLEKAGVIYLNKFKNSKKQLKLGIKYFGKVNEKFKEDLLDVIKKRKNIEIVEDINKSDLLLIIRINGQLKNILEDYSNINVPHLFIDLGYSNTISIGPLVFKTETACIACFIGKIAKNWGDLVPPEEPDIINHHELVFAFIIERIEEYINIGNIPDLVNGVWNFNINTFASRLDKIYKLPWCPRCNDQEENPKIDFAWIKEGVYDQ